MTVVNSMRETVDTVYYYSKFGDVRVCDRQ